MKLKKLISIMLAMMFVLSLLPATVLAENEPTITVQSVSAVPGTTVDVSVQVKNNPGVLGATLKVTYDSSLTLQSATSGSAFSHLTMTKPGELSSPCNFVWDGQDLNPEDIKDGEILLLKFLVRESVSANTQCKVNVSYTSGDIVDGNLKPVNFDIVNGSITVIDYKPGDLNSDTKINSTDIIMLRRHIAGKYVQTVNEMAGDVNADGTHNSTDIIMLRRYIADGCQTKPTGYNVELLPGKPKEVECVHELQTITAVAPTCTTNGNIAYWHCVKCNENFSDENAKNKITEEETVIKATGHTVIILPAVEPTYESGGKTEGKQCSVCHDVITEQIDLPPLETHEYNIEYVIDKDDSYLQSININNPNPPTYKSEIGLPLSDLFVTGYDFLGWFTIDGTQVTKIAVNETGKKTLYAHWQKHQYTVQFVSEMVPVESVPHFTGIETVLPKPSLDKYTFVGWSDANGKMWKTVPASTATEVILYANWASDRNMAMPVEHLGEPAIMEDSQNGLIYFSYKIGKIINVPLYEMSEMLTANGVQTEITTTKSTSQKVQTSKEMAKTLSEATTNSTSWTLSNNWNSVTEVSEAYLEEHGLEREEAEILAKNSAGSYTVGYQSGGTSGTTSSSSSNYAISNNDAHHREFEEQNEDSVITTVDHKFNAELGASFPISVVNVNAKVGYGYENNEVSTKSNNERNAGTDDWSSSENYNKSQSNTSSSSKTWNSTSNSSSSWSDSKTNSVKNAISEMVTREYNTRNEYAIGGSEGNTIGKETVSGQENKLSSTVLYDTTTISTEAATYRTTGNTHGGYRIVLAGTLQVYAVVIYDISTGEYSVQTYSVLGDGSDNDKPKPYLDYSWERNQFDDYQHSVIPFEVPYEVNGYVNSLVAKTDGLQFNPDKASVTKFDNELGSELVYVPTYISVDNGDDTYSFTKITALNKELFKNNTTITAVRLGNGITEIPEGAFEGCTNLKDVYAPNVTKIGDRAFAGCESLNTFTISEDITEIGIEAFNGVPCINATASIGSVAKSVAQSGANSIILNISAIPDDERDGIELEVGAVDSFELRGGGKEYSDLSIKSEANTTILNRITFTQNTRVPIELSSENVTLDQVSVDCSGYAMVLKADNTTLTLNRTTNSLISSTGIAALCKNIDIVAKAGSGFASSMQVNGDILVCDTYFGEEMVGFDSGEFKVISEEEYENYLSSHKISFDANGGNEVSVVKSVPLNSKIGELPKATRDYYTFDGWYMEAEGGEKVTEDTLMTSLTDITLYAHWVQNDVSEWVLNTEENVPSDAEIVDTSYSYTLTSYTSDSSSSKTGWEKYDTSWVWGPYGPWSPWSKNNPGESDSRKREWKQGSDWVDTSYNKDTSHYEARWRYYHWCGTRGNTDIYTYKYSSNYQYHEMSTPYELSVYRYASGSVPEYGPYDYCGRSNLWFRGGYSNDNGDYYWEQWVPSSEWVSQGYWNNYDLWRYCDRSKVYTYYFKKAENKELTSYPTVAALSSVTESNHPTGSYYSNIKEYVQYRSK